MFAGLLFIFDTSHYIVLNYCTAPFRSGMDWGPVWPIHKVFTAIWALFIQACKMGMGPLKLWAPVHSLMPIGSVHPWFRWSSEREELRMLLLTVLTNLITRCLACNLSNHISVEIDLYKTACSLIKGSWLEARRAYFWLIRSFEATNTRSLSRWRLAITLASGR